MSEGAGWTGAGQSVSGDQAGELACLLGPGEEAGHLLVLAQPGLTVLTPVCPPLSLVQTSPGCPLIG